MSFKFNGLLDKASTSPRKLPASGRKADSENIHSHFKTSPLHYTSRCPDRKKRGENQDGGEGGSMFWFEEFAPGRNSARKLSRGTAKTCRRITPSRGHGVWGYSSSRSRSIFPGEGAEPLLETFFRRGNLGPAPAPDKMGAAASDGKKSPGLSARQPGANSA